MFFSCVFILHLLLNLKNNTKLFNQSFKIPILRSLFPAVLALVRIFARVNDGMLSKIPFHGETFTANWTDVCFLVVIMPFLMIFQNSKGTPNLLAAYITCVHFTFFVDTYNMLGHIVPACESLCTIFHRTCVWSEP